MPIEHKERTSVVYMFKEIKNYYFKTNSYTFSQPRISDTKLS